jgi:hypothetical protein
LKTLCAGLSLLVGSGAAYAGTQMPSGSFLRQPAPDTVALNRALHTEPLVATRYARVFRQSPQALRKAFAQMVLTRLSQDRVLRVYYVHAGETIGYRVRRVRRGTPVYALRDGTPVLAQVCGNPLRSELSVPEMLLPPEQTAHIPLFDPNEPLPILQTSAVAQALGPMRSATPPLQLTRSGGTEKETPVTQNSSGGGGGGSTGIAALPLASAPFLTGIPSALLASLIPMFANRSMPTPGDFVPAQDVIPPNRRLPSPNSTPPVGTPSAPNPETPTDGTTPPSRPTPDDPIRDWVENPDTPPAPSPFPGDPQERNPLPLPSLPVNNPGPVIIGNPPDETDPDTDLPGGNAPLPPVGIVTPPTDLIPSGPIPSVPEPAFLALAFAALTSGSLLARRRKPKTLPAGIQQEA